MQIATPEANDLDSLHQTYSPLQILDLASQRQRANGFEGASHLALFLFSYRRYYGTVDGDEFATREYEAFLQTNCVPLFVARCLLPGCIC